ncbi:MAG: esterase-like activity of phytase family protein [Erythrobacter sp.]|nr:esterase-like activity of phytase family protein [Erythrobacter sp.]
MILRLSLTALLALALAPGTWLRTPVYLGLDAPIALREVDEPGAKPPPGWTLEGVWEYKGDGLLFGGYSALLALDDQELEAFSDRGGRFTFLQPDQPQGPEPTTTRSVAEQPVQPLYEMLLFDIESATRDARTGQYWLGYENTHAFQRHGPDGEVEGVRNIHGQVDWSANSGAEAMVRLYDGRFLVIPERGGEALLYPQDPLSGDRPETVAWEPPPGDFSVTDAAQLPDGRVLLLLRKVAWGVPPFEARIALADWPGESDAPVLAPKIALDLTSVAPPENYEGVAVREGADGALDIWVIADDNLSVMQRTLVVKLGFDPNAGKPSSPKQKARE